MLNGPLWQLASSLSAGAAVAQGCAVRLHKHLPPCCTAMCIVQGCDGGRLYFDGCVCAVVNGKLVAQVGWEREESCWQVGRWHEANTAVKLSVRGGRQ